MSSMNCVIDWEEQWRLHAPGFKKGFLPLEVAGKTLLLKPGPGFGDLSHPTTRLVLKLMKRHVEGKTVLDIGCGSGILSLAAKSLGAKKVIGIDIEADALLHARENAQLNGLDTTFEFPQNINIQQVDVVLINMILSEQKIALSALPGLRPLTWIASGLLKSQKIEYKEFCLPFGQQMIEEAKEGEWIAMRFINQ